MSQIKPCKLAILKRSVAEPSILTMDCQPEYWVGSECSPVAKDGWVLLQSNAQLLNRRDAQRDLLENEEFKNKNRICYADVYHETKFELVELIEKKSFGFIIKRIYQDGGEQYLANIFLGEASVHTRYQWLNSPLNATLLTKIQKEGVLGDLREKLPGINFADVELFCE